MEKNRVLTQSLTASPSLFDALGTEAFAVEQSKAKQYNQDACEQLSLCITTCERVVSISHQTLQTIVWSHTIAV